MYAGQVASKGYFEVVKQIALSSGIMIDRGDPVTHGFIIRAERVEKTSPGDAPVFDCLVVSTTTNDDGKDCLLITYFHENIRVGGFNMKIELDYPESLFGALFEETGDGDYKDAMEDLYDLLLRQANWICHEYVYFISANSPLFN